jgi:potassium-dependent mechanosensitive channel
MNSTKIVYQLSLSLLLLLTSAIGYGQKNHMVQDSIRSKRTGGTGIIKPMIHQDLMMGKDTLTSSDYMQSIERVNDNLSSIRDSAGLGFELEGMKRRIEEMTGEISIIRKNVRVKNSVVNIKNLYLYQSFISNLDEENIQLQASVARLYNRVYHAKIRLKNVMSDSVFRRLYNDSSLRLMYNKKLVRLERKWNRADSTTKAGVDTLNTLKVKLSDNSMNLSNMLNIMDTRLDKASRQLFGTEVNYLWQKSNKDIIANDTTQRVKGVLASEQKAISYYFGQTSGKRVFVLVAGMLLFIWLFLKRKLLKSLKKPNDSLIFLHIEYLNSLPVLSILVLLMSLMPLFDAYAPTSYVAIQYVLLLAIATAIFIKKEDLAFRFNWLALFALFIANTFTFLLIEPTFAGRLWLLAIQISTIVFSFLLLKKLKNDIAYYKWIKRAVLSGIILSGLGVLSNLFGRFSLSGILGIAGIYAVTQAVILPVFINTVAEIILLQLQSSRMKKGFDKPFESSTIIEKIKTPMAFVAILLWLIMLSSNLNIYHRITIGITDLLTTERAIGNISFKLVSVLYFFAIIWMAHMMQRLISFLLGETGIENEDTSPVSKKQHSRLLITRLLVLTAGYMLAIAASGLPLDKLTFLLGALGVGIGMGLQNIVNNFVSGIILIFDGSLKIGDEIEAGGQAGKVKEIGLHASTVSTADGADVIIPNGNILSQNIVNWTLSNNEKRVELQFTLSGNEIDANMISQVINGTVKNIPNVIALKKPVILFTRVTRESCSLTVRFWCILNKADDAKSESMLRLSAAFHDKNIGFD